MSVAVNVNEYIDSTYLPANEKQPFSDDILYSLQAHFEFYIDFELNRSQLIYKKIGHGLFYITSPEIPETLHINGRIETRDNFCLYVNLCVLKSFAGDYPQWMKIYLSLYHYILNLNAINSSNKIFCDLNIL